METETDNSEVVADVAELAHKANDAERAEAVIENVIENAQERIEQAERTAEQIAEAAMESARGERIETVEREISECRDESRKLWEALETIQQSLAEMSGQISALATLEVVDQMSQNSSSLTPPTLEVPEEVAETLETVIPENLSESVVVESPVQPVARAGRRWI